MKIPRRQKDILVKDFLEYKKFYENIPEDKKGDEELLLRNTIRIFYKIDNKKIDNLKYKTLLDMYKIIENILNTDQKPVERFHLNGIEYGLIPDFTDLTLGEMVDCNTEDVIQQIAVLYRPIIKKRGNNYKIGKYEADMEHKEELENILTLDIYSGFVSFFLSIQKDFMRSTQKSLMEMDMDQETRSNLEKSGVGTAGFMYSLMKI